MSSEAVDYFDVSLLETVNTPENDYVQKYESPKGYAVFYRTSRYGRPEKVVNGLQERDADQILLAAETEGVKHLLQEGQKGGEA